MIGLHAVEKGADDGHAAHAACLEIKARIVAFGGPFELMGEFTDELLVGGDDRLSRVQSVENELARLADAAHHFDDDIDVGVGNDFRDVGSDVLLGDAERLDAVFAELQNADDFKIDVLRLLIKFPMLFQDLIGAAPDDPEPENGDADFFHIIPPNSSNHISTSSRRV